MKNEKVLILNACWTSGFRVRVDHICHSRKAAEKHISRVGGGYYFALIPAGGVTSEEVGDWVKIYDCDETFGYAVMYTGAAIQQMRQLERYNGWMFWINI